MTYLLRIFARTLTGGILLIGCEPADFEIAPPSNAPDPIVDIPEEPIPKEPSCGPTGCPRDILPTPMHMFFGPTIAGQYASSPHRSWSYLNGDRIADIETVNFHTWITQYGRRDFLVEIGLVDGTFETYCTHTDLQESFTASFLGLRRGCLGGSQSGLQLMNWRWISPYTAEVTLCIMDATGQPKDCGRFEREGI